MQGWGGCWRALLLYALAGLAVLSRWHGTLTLLYPLLPLLAHASHTAVALPPPPPPQGLRPMLVAVAASNFVYFYAYHAAKARVLAARRPGRGGVVRVLDLPTNVAIAAVAGAM